MERNVCLPFIFSTFLYVSLFLSLVSLKAAEEELQKVKSVKLPQCAM